MGFLDFFSLSVLDTRLDPPQDEKKRQQIALAAGPPRWKTTEFYVYAVVFLVAVPMMFKAGIDASSCKYLHFLLYTANHLADNINYVKYEHMLSDGWMGRKVVCFTHVTW